MSVPALLWPGQQDESPYAPAFREDTQPTLTVDRGRVAFDPAWLVSTAPKSWCWHWPHNRLVQDALDRVERGEIRKLIIIQPPRHGKSETATVRFPVYWLERHPTHRVMIGSHTQQLANKFSRKARKIARQRLALASDRSAVEEWDTAEGGGLRAVGVGVAVAGYGGNLIVVDDPVRSRKEAESEAYRDSVWEWYTDDLYTRLEPGGAIVISMTRWHEDDLVGRILTSEDAPNWTVLRLPALAEPGDLLKRKVGEALCPDRYDEAALASIKVVQGSYGFSALYQGRPAPPEGGIFKRVWWRFWAPAALLKQLPPVAIKLPDGSFKRVPAVALPDLLPFQAQSWDMAFKEKDDNDFVCGGAWAKAAANFYLLDMVKEHLDFPGTVQAVRDFTAQHPKATAKWVEGKANGPAVIQSLRNEIPGLIEVEPEGGKEARAHAAAPLVEAGNVFLPHPALVQQQDGSNWVEDLIDSAATFPHAAHDDDVDQLTQALNRMSLPPTPRRQLPGSRSYATG